MVYVVVVLHVRPVLPGLPDEVPPVGGGVEQDVVRLRLHTALNDGFQELVLHLVLLKGEVVNKDDEAVVPVLHHRDHGGQIAELVLVDLDHAQALVIVLVDEGLHAGGLARARVAIEQGVVGAPPGQEGFRVRPQLFLLALVAHQILQHDLVRIINGDKPHAVRPGLDAEGFVQPDEAHAVLLIMLRHQVEEALLIRGRRQLLAQRPDFLADILVVPALMLINGLVVPQGREAVDAQVPLDDREIIVEQRPEHAEVTLGKVVHRSVQLPHPLGDEAEGVLVGHEQKCQIVLPQILVKPIVRGQVQQPLHLVIDAPDQNLPGRCAALPLLKNTGQLPQDALFPQVSVQQ